MAELDALEADYAVNTVVELVRLLHESVGTELLGWIET